MIHIVWNERQAQQAWRQGRNVYAHYVFEMFAQAGLAYEIRTPEAWLAERPGGLTVVIGLDDSADWSAVFQSYCDDGNALLAIGSTFGLDGVLGASGVRTIREGSIRWGDSPLAEGLRSSFHFFGATLVTPVDGTETYGSIVQKNGMATAHPAVTMRSHASGAAAMIAVDLPRTFCLIQQGVAVEKDGIPAEDGTAAIHDDTLKTDDSVVLDWTLDRVRVEEGSAPFFLHPVVDEFRILLMRVLHRLHSRIGKPFAQVWFWPEGLRAIGHISHDTDGNLAEAAEIMLDRLKETGIKSTWCIIMPGYPDSIYDRIVAEGHEIALHYNALEAQDGYWDEDLFVSQLEMLKSRMKQPVRILTNKNHYLRWEGDVQFYRWCERAGIVVEQSKGGTKQGNKGFLAGTCHPYLPVSDASEQNRLMNVYSVPTLAWDPPVPLRCTMPEAKAILHRCLDVYGVAHFLYHPTLFKQEDAIGPAFVELVRYGQAQGLEWWTSERLYEWLQLRRGVRVSAEKDGLAISAERDCKGLTVLLDGLSVPTEEAVGRHEAVRSVRTVERYGIPMRELVLDVPAGETKIPLAAGVTLG